VKLNNAYTKVIYKRYPNMNYSAEKLAVIFECTVSDIMDINREIQRMHHVLEIPELVANIMRYIPNDCFNPRFNLYPLWWAVAERELGERHKKAEEVYYDALEECDEAHEKLDEMENTLEDWEEITAYEIAYENASKKEAITFRELVEIERALLRCRFVTQESDWEKWTQMYHNIELIHGGLTPFLEELLENPESVVVEYDDTEDEE
jgi:hypothetical protein